MVRDTRVSMTTIAWNKALCSMFEAGVSFARTNANPTPQEYGMGLGNAIGSIAGETKVRTIAKADLGKATIEVIDGKYIVKSETGSKIAQYDKDTLLTAVETFCHGELGDNKQAREEGFYTIGSAHNAWTMVDKYFITAKFLIDTGLAYKLNLSESEINRLKELKVALPPKKE